ncbi:MAG: hypothetical protein KF718_15410 [Polyangiaceae bacterium]|nr:hypothetical protein [Polyangiaceae bacterium]
MGPNRIFFPQGALDRWVHEGRVDLQGSELVILGEGRRYRVIEAVRVLAEVTGGEDSHELVGNVKSVPFLTELGAEVFDTSMLIGDLAYEVVPGFMGTPVGSFSEHRSRSVPPVASAGPNSDEEMLAQFLENNLQ